LISIEAMGSSEKSLEEGFNPALGKARRWCASEERCPYDIKLKLIKLECPPEEITRIIEQITEEGFINEQRYANAYVSGKFRISKWGKIKITAGLRMKNIHDEIITNALNIIDNETYRDCLRSLLIKKQKELKSLPALVKRQKLARYALQKGFETELVFSILKTSEDK
jgi:regulatory protein